MKPCPFCPPDPSKVLLANTHALSISDNFPISPGHALIIPKRHIASFFELTTEEQGDMLALLAEMRERLLNPPRPPFDKGGRNIAPVDERGLFSVPNGFNIGINDGAAAGQTVMHLHIHLIPRYTGDQPDPRGGVRWIFPDKAAYWDK